MINKTIYTTVFQLIFLSVTSGCITIGLETEVPVMTPTPLISLTSTAQANELESAQAEVANARSRELAAKAELAKNLGNAIEAYQYAAQAYETADNLESRS